MKGVDRMQKKAVDTRRLIVMAMFCALAFLSTAFFRIPVVLWLKFDPKDCLIAIGGMLYGPAAALIMSVAVSLLEMITISDTGVYGMIMNVLSTTLFVLPAAFLYRHRRRLSIAIAGLVLGALLATGGMLLWNWLIVPLYMPSMTRAEIVPLLWSAFLPFNLFKTALNAVLTVLLYKGVVSALRAARLVPKADNNVRRGISMWVVSVSAFLLLTLSLVLLAWRGVL